MPFNLKGLLQDEEFLLGAGLLSAGSQGQNLGAALMPSLVQAGKIKKAFTPKNKERRIVKGNDGFQYYADTGERVLPNVKQVPKDTRTNLMKNLESAGYVPGTPEYKQALIASLAKTEVGASGLGLKQPANRDKATIAADYSLKGLDFIKRINDISKKSPDAFGLKGVFKGFGKDLTTEVEEIFKDAQIYARESGGIDASALAFIDNKDFSGIKPLQNALKIIVGRSRNPNNKLLKDMIKDAESDTDLRGLGGVQKAQEKLQFLAAELTDSAIRQFKASGKSNQEINELIEPYKNIFSEQQNQNISESQEKNPKKLPRWVLNPKTGKLELVDE